MRSASRHDEAARDRERQGSCCAHPKGQAMTVLSLDLKPIQMHIAHEVHGLHVHKGELVTVYLHGTMGTVQVQLHVTPCGSPQVLTKEAHKACVETFERVYPEQP